MVLLQKGRRQWTAAATTQTECGDPNVSKCRQGCNAYLWPDVRPEFAKFLLYTAALKTLTNA